jgi:hypothetical protein
MSSASASPVRTFRRSGPGDEPLSPWTCWFMALLAGGGGLAAAYVTTGFFLLGLQRLETDPAARTTLSAAAILMVGSEMLCFGLAGLLPRTTMRGVRGSLIILGAALLAFEGVTVYSTQVVLARAAQTSELANTTRIEALRALISSEQDEVAALRENAQKQTASQFSWVRSAGADALRNALAVEPRIESQSVELARLQAASRPTMIDVLSEHGMIAYSVARSILMSCMGAVLFGAAGGLLRSRRTQATASMHRTPATADAVAAAASAPAVAPLPALRSAGGRFAMAAFAATSPAIAAAAPGVTMQPPSITNASVRASSTASLPMQCGRSSDAARSAPVAMQPVKPRAGQDDTDRFERVRAAVLAGDIRPSLRAIYEFSGASQAVATRYLGIMERTGEIRRHGRHHVLV